jgi:hypothetical protein
MLQIAIKMESMIETHFKEAAMVSYQHCFILAGVKFLK